MNRTGVAIFSGLTVAAMALAAIIAGAGLPADVQLPVHWNITGEADRFAPKWVALLMPAGMAAILSLLFYVLPAIEPRREGLQRSRGLYLAAWIALLMISAAVQAIVLSAALGWGWSINRILAAVLGVMLVLIGNQFGKSRSTYTIGIRTPWTLASEEVWIRTHRLAGKLTVAGGAALIAAALLPIGSGVMIGIILAVVLLIALVPAAYSFFLWRAQPSENRSTGE